MRGSSRAVSTPVSIVCPICEVGRLSPRGCYPARCGSCGSVVGGEILEVLRRITALPEALGAHACECGHPEMRLLPDGVYRCPACGSEVLPAAYYGGFPERQGRGDTP
jgi:DNA-directed RNA polymerase subunit N (RpoN/RPB10)